MNVWKRTLRTVQIVLLILWVSILLYLAMVLLRIPPIPSKEIPQMEILFYLFLSLAVATWLASWIFLGRTMDEDHLEQTVETAADPEGAALALASVMRVNPIIMAALGESSAVYGLLLYFISGDTQRPWIFFIIALAHVGWVWARFNRARTIAERLLEKEV